jgi:hypothetical protein
MKEPLTDTPLTPGRGTTHNPSLMVEVAEQGRNINNESLSKHRAIPQDNKNASTFFTKSVLDRYPDVVKSNIGRPSSGRVACLYLLGLNPRSAFYENDSETILCLTADSEVVGKTKFEAFKSSGKL